MMRQIMISEKRGLLRSLCLLGLRESENGAKTRIHKGDDLREVNEI